MRTILTVDELAMFKTRAEEEGLVDRSFHCNILSPQSGECFPRIYEPAPPIESTANSRFGISVHSGMLPNEVKPYLPCIYVASKTGLVRMNSQLRPPVIPVDRSGKRIKSDSLVREIQELDAMNMARDRIFKGRIIRVQFRPFWFQHPRTDHSGIGLGLEEIHLTFPY